MIVLCELATYLFNAVNIKYKAKKNRPRPVFIFLQKQIIVL
ncbi:hypothetical protein PTRA_a1051 [Pseudoalteromonas translucida KMM 520]|uniref:Uncharacterized protein n=1 Tax=Pseudoalteromonas translucida KMM 520 TaxID=1315283 RepID=A0A0U2WXD5_9GAMM|nr:hypothetical protein PTRA_a1051 [Pseudoalteromonas translucida KMM 520]